MGTLQACDTLRVVYSQRRILRREGEALIRRSTGDRTAPSQSGASTTRCRHPGTGPPRAARLALLAIPLLALAAASSLGANAVGTVLPHDGLHLRAGPGTQHPSLEVLPGGTRIALTGPLSDTGWYPAIHSGRRGWVRGEFVDVPPDAGAITQRATVRASDGLVLRDEPHINGTKLVIVPNGAVLTVSTRTTSDGWVLAAYAGLTGWATADAVQIDGAPAPTPTGTAVRATITFYHPSFEGSGMACGGRYRAEDPTIAAATSWPCGTRLRVCRNSACIIVTVQDTGHMGPNWVDLSTSAFRQLAPLAEAMVTGTVEVLKD